MLVVSGRNLESKELVLWGREERCDFLRVNYIQKAGDDGAKNSVSITSVLKHPFKAKGGELIDCELSPILFRDFVF